MFYNVELVASTAPPRATVVLEAPARQVVSRHISISNPLESEVKLTGSCTSPLVGVPGSTAIAPHSAADFMLCYRPLAVGDQTATVAFKCTELGDYSYNLQLRGLPTGPEQQVSFSVALGSSETRICRVTHWLPAKIDYSCSLKSTRTTTSKLGFACPAKVAAGAAGVGLAAGGPGIIAVEGLTVEVEVVFEPMMVGEEFRDALVLEHPEGGLYEVPLIGHCAPPKP